MTIRAYTDAACTQPLVRRVVSFALTIALSAALVLAVLALSGTLRPAPVAPPLVVVESSSTVTPLTNLTPITVYWRDYAGVDVMPPETMTLSAYAGPRRTYTDHHLRAAIEADLHAGDATWHRTHEEIDGGRW